MLLNNRKQNSQNFVLIFQSTILVGQKKAISFAVRNKKNTNRFTKLKEWLV